MTGTEFYNYVLRKFKRTDKSTEAYEAMTDTIALMEIKFNSEELKEESYTSAISTLGEYQIALPSDFGHIIGEISLTDTGDDSYYDELKKISKQRYDILYPDRLLTTVGNVNLQVPKNFCIYADQIYLGGVPDKTTYRYQFNYTTQNTTEIASGTAVVPFTSKFNTRNVLRAGVLFELHDGLENYEEAAYWKSVFLDGLNDIMENDQHNIDDREGVVYSGF